MERGERKEGKREVSAQSFCYATIWCKDTSTLYRQTLSLCLTEAHVRTHTHIQTQTHTHTNRKGLFVNAYDLHSMNKGMSFKILCKRRASEHLNCEISFPSPGPFQFDSWSTFSPVCHNQNSDTSFHLSSSLFCDAVDIIQTQVI